MSVLDGVKERVKPKGPTGLQVPPSIQDRMQRGRKDMLKDAPKRRLCARMERGDLYWYITEKGQLSFLPTVSAVSGGGKPPHRVRNKYNYIRPIIQAKVSAATQRVPSYDVSPSTTDPTDEGASRLSEQVALYGYDKWRLRGMTIKVATMAIGHGGDGFAMPYFDPNVAPYTMVDGKPVGQGEIRTMTLSGNEVYWEPGVDFMDSPWWAVERARPVEELRRLPGFVGGTVAADATTSDIPTDRRGRDNLAMVTEYLERPSPKYPNGRRVISAGGRVIVDARTIDPTAEGFWEDYPLKDHDGQVLDEPVLHRLSYTQDPELDRDFGLTWQLIDFQRTAQDAMNKMVEWKNRSLVPQWMAPQNSIIDPITDTPGAVFQYRGINPPQQVQVQPIPDTLFRIKQEALEDMRNVAQDINLDASQNAAASNTQQIIEQSANRWQSFLGDLAEFHSRFMRHCLLLVARHYTEPRLLQIRGRFGPYPVKDFRGAQLMGQVNVTVLPGSLEVRTRQQVTQQVLAFADRGWVTPQAAMAAIQGGTAEKLIEGFELDVARANRIVQKIQDGSIMEMPSRPMTQPAKPLTDEMGMPVLGPDGQPVMGAPETIDVPAWMPRPYDTPEVWKHVLSDYMKTEAFEALPPEMQEVATMIYDGIIKSQDDQNAAAQAAQNAQAQQLGAANAAAPQDKGMPSLPGGTGTPLPT